MKKTIQFIVILLLIPVMFLGFLAGITWSGVKVGFNTVEDFWR